MKIYFDVCCLCRPYDDLSQARVHLESEAVLAIMKRCKSADWSFATSEVIDTELLQMHVSNTMTVNYHNPIEIREIGLDALRDALGTVGMVYFLRQFEQGRGDYTEERKELLSNVTEEDFERDLTLLRSNKDFLYTHKNMR